MKSGPRITRNTIPFARQLDHDGATDQHIQPQRIRARAVIEEMARRVDVRARVRAERELRHIGARAVGDTLDRLDPELRFAGVGGHPQRERHRNVEVAGRIGHRKR